VYLIITHNIEDIKTVKVLQSGIGSGKNIRNVLIAIGTPTTS
jgi:hypothetical protein